MGPRNCMNEACSGTTLSELKNGWALKSGGFATLCSDCGSAYANSLFCETFHLKESGWRECKMCFKRIHCGCIASRYLYECTDSGGIVCISCAKHLEIHPVPIQLRQIPGDTSDNKCVTNGATNVCQMTVENRKGDDLVGMKWLQPLNNSTTVGNQASSFEQANLDKSALNIVESSKLVVPDLTLRCTSSVSVETDSNRIKEVLKNTSDPSKGSFQHEQSAQIPFTNPPKPNPSKPNPLAALETNKGTATVVSRPPDNGRGRNQLLPRYWPRIADEELQQLCVNLNSKIIPLFEKTVSASDAGRIGRLVLPKACAEAFFPLINQSEGIPLKVQDTTGKEWTFQFRYWPNNNSRMYVLEGIIPCIQNLQLQAGDAVFFSRKDPGGQLVIGRRKATTNPHDARVPGVLNGDKAPVEAAFSSVTENQLSQQVMTLSENKASRNIKNKRLLMHNDDAVELRLTWKEAQELFRPSPSSEPTIVMIDGHEFEEFEEPPIFGKRTHFITLPSGEQKQVVQCDSCLKWRFLPVHAVVSAKWTCSDNIWDTNRCLCSAEEDINPMDLECLGINKDSVNLKSSDNRGHREEEPLSGLDALASAAVLGGEVDEFRVGEHRKHPRHRPGCTCIVCIQPPSGTEKHDPSCKCNVCLTVRRRFKTLSMRKKQRPEREASARDNSTRARSDSDREDTAGQCALPNMNHPHPENNRNESKGQTDTNEMNHNVDGVNSEAIKKGQLDLNCHPHNDDDIEETATATASTGMNSSTVTNLSSGSVPVHEGSPSKEGG